MNQGTKENLISYQKKIAEFIKIPPVGAEGERKEIYIEFKNFLTYYSRLIDIAIKEEVPIGIIGTVSNYWPTIEIYIKELKSLFIGEGGDLTSIYNRLSGFCNSIYSFRNPPVPDQPPLIVYASLLTGLESRPYDEEQISKINFEYNDKLQKVNSLIQLLNSEVNKLNIEKYALIFKKEAEKYSNSKVRIFTKSKQRILFGSSERWLTLSFLSFALATIILFCYDLKLDFEKYNFIEWVGFGDWLELFFKIIKKSFLIGIFIFLGRYSLRRFTVAKNLYTENIHRHNVLNSFRLLYETSKIDEAKADLMIEVATSIFASSKQPYNEGKTDNGIDLNSIVEILKLTRPSL
ncbi:hypothetical protein [Leptospira licerasiae]|uniref:hypothetical protein n=1 Tax=Leptospira licerasiae TaxID=447106 RepID=UPI00301A8E2B